MKILITGTHLTPALAVINELRKVKAIDILYVGRKTTREGDKTASMESSILPRVGVKYLTITTGRFQRNFTVYTIPSLLKIPVGIIQSLMIVSTQKPDVILSFGGYLSFPIVLAGWLCSIPIIIHEQTLVPSLANRLAAIFAQKVAVSYDQKFPYSKEKIILTGNPIRSELLENGKEASGEIKDFVGQSIKKRLPLIYITGGNQGSHIINETVESILKQLSKIAFIIHQTGDSKYKDYERISFLVKKLKLENRVLIYKWINTPDLRLILDKTDMVISRAGINTLMELAYFKVPALVIPYPFLYQNEQVVNAKYFEKRGLVKVLLQSDLSGKELLQKIEELLTPRELIKKLDTNGESLVKDAAKRIAIETISLCKKG
ncbi:UDP-N-acetylglucosamine--N-acetylmuramyl-(pentapeptide) pyrophosphoryl-undecaprenol N-acetylglucosamine transferase [Candidatus Daviesbacteria bacterium]|nr:UDP-N-acetylglucosamine--N-acetylmuramyl-(pentapeptide) pyrophosphoryl-undecaprenol N-acetylglucosamine transferase [Candidatus Daviesbacteria bacterium]